MRKSTRMLSLLLGFAGVAASWAGVPFKTTSITSDGEFADTTTWYTIKIGKAGAVISDNGENDHIALTTTTTMYDHADQWCVVGDDTNGYRLYNRQAGSKKVLASPKTMSEGDEGGKSFVILKDVDQLGDDYVADWLFADSNDWGTDANGQYMYQKDNVSNKVNNRDNKLAFWTGGADLGSALKFEFAEGAFDVTPSTGTGLSTTSFGKVWTSNSTKPRVVFSTGYNNNKIINGYITLYVGSSKSPLTITTATGDTITGYSFDFCNYDATDVTLTANGVTYTATAEDQHVSVTGLKTLSTSFSLDGSNKGIYIKNFKVYVKMNAVEPEPQTNLFEYGSAGNTICYRIPAIAKAYNGDLVAVTDYRYNGSDIGGGVLDLRARISTDNGQTWGDIFTIVKGSDYTDTSNRMNTGFGDPCLVADRESSRMLLISCSGNVMYPSGTPEHHQAMARFYSTDNGRTWSDPVDISDAIYSQFDDSKLGAAASMFIGSGRIFQSSTVKVGEYYRLYCSVLFKDVNGGQKNYVLYSDDFGGEWSVLGGVDVAPIPSDANEPKVEELPDGSILCSSRCSGRYYNIFTFTDSEKAEGSWGTVAHSGTANNGTFGANCNGEVMVLPARRVSDNAPVFLALQSIPIASDRRNVGIYYKELASLDDFNSPANFAKDWDGYHQSSYIGSAYSTMTLQADNTLGFVYEESTFGRDYTIVYKNYTIDYITDEAYTYDPTVSADDIVAAGIDGKYELIKSWLGNNVGNIKAEAEGPIASAYDAYVSAPSKELYEAFNKSYLDAERVKINTKINYRLRNKLYPTNYLVAGTSGLSAAELNEASNQQLFAFYPVEEGTEQYYVVNEASNVYFGKTPAIYNNIPVTATAQYSYVIDSSLEGHSSLTCTDPTAASNASLHLDSSKKLVPWTTSSEASRWFLEPTLVTSIDGVEANGNEDAPEVYYDLSGRKVDVLTRGVYVTSKRRKVYVK